MKAASSPLKDAWSHETAATRATARTGILWRACEAWGRGNLDLPRDEVQFDRDIILSNGIFTAFSEP